jgi:predicted nuclease with TOPRIM domain
MSTAEEIKLKICKVCHKTESAVEPIVRFYAKRAKCSVCYKLPLVKKGELTDVEVEKVDNKVYDNSEVTKLKTNYKELEVKCKGLEEKCEELEGALLFLNEKIEGLQANYGLSVGSLNFILQHLKLDAKDIPDEYFENEEDEEEN